MAKCLIEIIENLLSAMGLLQIRKIVVSAWDIKISVTWKKMQCFNYNELFGAYHMRINFALLCSLHIGHMGCNEYKHSSWAV